MPVNDLEIRDLDFCSDTQRVLSYHARRIKDGTISSIEKKLETKLLKDLIFFLMGQEVRGALAVAMPLLTQLGVGPSLSPVCPV